MTVEWLRLVFIHIHQNLLFIQDLLNNMKKKYLNPEKITIIANSKWLQGMAKKSSLMKNFKIHCVYNPIETDFWNRAPKEEACKKLKIQNPVISNDDLDKIKNIDHPDYKAIEIPSFLISHDSENFNVKKITLGALPLYNDALHYQGVQVSDFSYSSNDWSKSSSQINYINKSINKKTRSLASGFFVRLFLSN